MFRIIRLLGIVVLTLGVIADVAPTAAGGRKSGPKYENLNGGPYYLQIERIVVPRIRDDAVDRLMTYFLIVEFADAESRERAKLVMPKLMDAYLHDLHILTSRPGAPDNGADLTVAKRYLIASTARILGPDSVKDVLIERAVVRRTG